MTNNASQIILQDINKRNTSKILKASIALIPNTCNDPTKIEH